MRDFKLLAVIVAITLAAVSASAQPVREGVRTVTLPISIFTKQELREDQAAEFVRADKLTVREDKEEQQILSIRSVSNTPLALAILIQDDLGSNFNLQLRDLSEFVRRLPRGTRVMIGYSRGGSLQIRQKFTDDLDKAAGSIRIASGGTGGSGTYGALQDTLRRFEALPAGRRAVLLISDGVDTLSSGRPSRSDESVDFQRAVDRAQRQSIAVYTFFSPTSLSDNSRSPLTLGGQGALQTLADETGGRAFFQGTSAPVSFMPFIRDLNILLNRQFALTYLSTHTKKGYYKVEVTSSNPEVKIEHPKGYYYR